MEKSPPGKIIGNSPRMMELLEIVRIIATKDVRVLIRGERGTGKELIADQIYSSSLRSKMPFIKLNCAVLNRDLLASELFGHVKGSFTGATDTRTGLIIAADGGTIFLDEVADLSLEAQAAILRFLQEGEVRPLGSLQTFRVDVRVISATNKDLEHAMAQGRFREDLFDRLNGFSLEIPPIRERREDIPALVAHFIARYNRKYNESVSGFSKDAMLRIIDGPWKGNVRELENFVSRAIILSRGKRRIGLSKILGHIPIYRERISLNEKQKTIIGIIKAKGKVTVSEMLPLLGISGRAVRNHLQPLISHGLVQMEGSKRNTVYTLDR